MKVFGLLVVLGLMLGFSSNSYAEVIDKEIVLAQIPFCKQLDGGKDHTATEKIVLKIKLDAPLGSTTILEMLDSCHDDTYDLIARLMKIPPGDYNYFYKQYKVNFRYCIISKPNGDLVSPKLTLESTCSWQ